MSLKLISRILQLVRNTSRYIISWTKYPHLQHHIVNNYIYLANRDRLIMFTGAVWRLMLVTQGDEIYNMLALSHV